MLIKAVHVTCAVLTFMSFGLRGFWMYTGSGLLSRKIVRVLPHIIDTCLLLSGLAMAILWYEDFYTLPWLQAKLGALLLYIIAGAIALKYGSTRGVRTVALFASLLIFFYIILVARSRIPDPWSLWI